MVRFRHSYGFITGLLLLFAASGCSVEKNTGASRFYHGLTARYNIYHNGYESFRSGIDKITREHTDDFGDILMLFEYSDPASARVCAADMERAIQKASKLITLKSITARPESGDAQPPRDEDFYNLKEYNRWVDDSYLLMAKARFYTRDFSQARATLAFNSENSTDVNILTEGTIWLARIQAETGNPGEALRILGEIENPGSLSSSLQAMYHTTRADALIRQKFYREAIDQLHPAIENSKGKRQKYRLSFIQAQLYGATGQPEKAISTFSDVIKLRPPYEIEFNARIGMATVYEASAGSSANIRSDLISMTRDEKNKDFLDQIYLALGRLSEKEGKMEEAIGHYRTATRSGSSGTSGRGRAYLALASHYYEIPDYVNASNYYDSAVVFLNEQFPGFDEIRMRSENLTELAGHLEIISNGDSLRRVAAMNEQERTLIIAGIIEKVRQDEMEMATQQGGSSDMYNLGQFYENERRFRDNIEMEGQWYFYNQAALTFGRTEFRRRWGERKLEDNWRRQNKRVVQMGDITEEHEPGKADTIISANDRKSPEFYLRNLPLTDSLMAISKEISVNALFAAGQVYASSFGDIPRAVKSYTDLIALSPGHEYIPQAYYHLYLLLKEPDPSRAETYRQLLLNSYGDTEYALILTDPDYYKKQREREIAVSTLYDEAYNLFLSGNFEASRALCEKINSTAAGHQLIPKVRLLLAMNYAGTGDERTYREGLSALVKLFPGTGEAERAKELMAALDQELPELRVEEDRQIAAEIYIHEPGTEHLFALIIEDPAFNINQATFDVINFNIDNYTNKNFRAEGNLIDNKFILLTVGRFTETAEALQYYNNFDALRIIRNSTPATTKTFIISARNLDTLKSDKDPSRYMLFFREKYLNSDEPR
ncbi:MAG: tetratricopeptide repeat protein [Bacteroidetes bacterium]|nr:tetratricopeptide repeat protein [Bacteroidota bacterium]